MKLELREKDDLIEQINSENEHYKKILQSQNDPNSNQVSLLIKFNFLTKKIELQNMQEENHELTEQLESTELQNKRLREIISHLELKIAQKEESTPVKKDVKSKEELLDQEQSIKIIQNLETKCRILLERIEKKENERKEAQEALSELTQEKEEMLSEIDYYKDMAKMSKKHAEKAIADVEFYKNLLQKRE